MAFKVISTPGGSESVVVMGGKDGQWITITEKMNSSKCKDRKVGGPAAPWYQLSKLAAEMLLIKT